QRLIYQTHTLLHLVDADHHPCPHIPLLETRNQEGQLVICRVRMIAPGVRVDTTGAGRKSDHLEFAYQIVAQHTGGLQAVQHRGAVQRYGHDLVEVFLDLLDGVDGGGNLKVGEFGDRHAAGHDGSSQQTVSREPVVEPKHVFSKPQGMGIGDGKAGIRAYSADIRNVVIEALQFLKHHPKVVRALWHFHARAPLNGHAIRKSVRHARVARHAFGQLGTAGKVHRFEQLFNALVQKEETGFEVHNRLALDAETKMAGFDNTGMNRAHRDLVGPFTLHLLKWKWPAIV